MSWQTQLKGNSVSWLLEMDLPGVHYLALRDLYDLPNEEAELKSARRIAHKEGLIAAILSHMDKEGYWASPGADYYPKYVSTVWSMIILAQLGASVTQDKRIPQASKYLLDHALARVVNLRHPAPSPIRLIACKVTSVGQSSNWAMMTQG